MPEAKKRRGECQTREKKSMCGMWSILKVVMREREVMPWREVVRLSYTHLGKAESQRERRQKRALLLPALKRAKHNK